MRLSIVIPALNEEGNIGRLVDETYRAVPDPLLGEVIVVDDGSIDGTVAEIQARMTRFDTLRVLRHAHRTGQSAALRSGVCAARFSVIATMDGDGQNDPADIARLFGHLGAPGEEPALVGGIRVKRNDTGSKRFASRFANWVRDKALQDGCPDTGCGIKIFRRDAYLALPYFNTMHRYLPALFQSYGHQIEYDSVNDRKRLAGASKYTNFGRALIGVYDLFGVTWLRKRTKIGEVLEDGTGGDSSDT